ncbi:uncharacterized protein LOC106662063 [Cimex lectularius]|uniref:Uncharacterized protein n=1 Tax=Cimex lectularius TaxID=79782 RepID=A0A8I6RBB0_CIMLE|nr:uncharacterized protein LOC106662063 [Cimex lectularius]
MKLRSVFAVVFVSLGLSTGLEIRENALENCGDDRLGTCIRIKALAFLDKALAYDAPLVVNDFLTITRDAGTANNSSARFDTKTHVDQGTKDDVLDEMIMDRILNYLRSRSLQFTIPANIIEGRKRGGGKKGGMIMMAALAMGGMMVQLAMGKVALLAGKALLVGKMALFLSAIIALKKLFGSGGGGGDSHPQVVYAESHGSGGGHGGWGRSFDPEGMQQLAYHAQAVL